MIKKLCLTVMMISMSQIGSAQVPTQYSDNDIWFPDGANSFADAVVSYDNHTAAEAANPPMPVPDSEQSNPDNAIGIPDSTNNNGCNQAELCTSVSLGHGGSVVMQFTDNALTGSDSAHLDLWIFEVGPDVEDSFIAVSEDGVTWFEVGKIFGSTSGIDLDAYGFGRDQEFYYVRITDDITEGNLRDQKYAGADIDAVGAISSRSLDSCSLQIDKLVEFQESGSGSGSSGAPVQQALGTEVYSETLGDPTIAIASGTGVVTAGTGMITQPGIIDIDVPIGAEIKQVLLYWEGFMSGNLPGDDEVIVDDGLGPNSVTGILIGGPTNFIYSEYASTYRADITDLDIISDGANSLTVSGMAYNLVNNGAGILVIYDDGSSEVGIQLKDGSDLAYHGFGGALQGTVPQTFTITPSTSGRLAQLDFFFASISGSVSNAGDFRPSVIEVTTSGHSGSPEISYLTNRLDSVDGDEWDTLTVNIDIPPDTTTLTVQAFSRDDLNSGDNPASLDWLMVALSLESGGCISIDGQPCGDWLYTYTVTNLGADIEGLIIEDQGFPDPVIGAPLPPNLAGGEQAVATFSSPIETPNSVASVTGTLVNNGGFCSDTTTANDFDGDGYPDDLDNCVYDFNDTQKDSDGNGVGNACEYKAGGILDNIDINVNGGAGCHYNPKSGYDLILMILMACGIFYARLAWFQRAGMGIKSINPSC